MNDLGQRASHIAEASLTELKRTVERAVRPIRATMVCKRRMREELLAHLVSIFEEELQKSNDAPAALDHARRRFGDPAELTGQLQQSVPRWDRVGCLLERWRFRPGQSVLRHAWIHGLLVFAAYAAVLCLVLSIPDVLAHGRQGEPAVLFIASLLIAATGAVLSLAFFLLPLVSNKPESGWSLRKAGLYGLAAVPLFVFTFYLAGMLLLLPLLLILERQCELGEKCVIVSLVAAVVAAFSFVFSLLLDRIALALSKGRSRQTMRKVVFYSLASVPLLPLATFLLYGALAIDASTSTAVLRVACVASLVLPLLLIVIARPIAEKQRYEESWASLETHVSWRC